LFIMILHFILISLVMVVFILFVVCFFNHLILIMLLIIWLIHFAYDVSDLSDYLFICSIFHSVFKKLSESIYLCLLSQLLYIHQTINTTINASLQLLFSNSIEMLHQDL
jgi:hypothetical protein